MRRSGMLRFACAVTALMAAPAFAQSNTQPAEQGAGGTVNAPMARPAPGPSGSVSDQGTGMTPRSSMGMSSDSGRMGGHGTGMAATHGTMRPGKGDSSQSAAVDMLNDQSYAAAQKGEAFTGRPSTGGSMSTPRDQGGGHSRM